MKKALKILSFALVLAFVLSGFVSCKRPSGTYQSATGTKYIFDGSSYTYVKGDVELSGTYEIKKVDNGYRIYLTVEQQKVGSKVEEMENPEILGGEGGLELRGCKYEKGACEHEGGHYIFIDEARYVLQ